MPELEISAHISHAFNEELEAVRTSVLEMGGLVEHQLGEAVRAMVGGRRRPRGACRTPGLSCERDGSGHR